MKTADRKKLINKIVDLDQQIGQAVTRDKLSAWLELSLTIGQLKRMFFIDFENSMNFRKPAAALGVTPPDVTRIIDRLVEQGLVSREENVEDRRMQRLKITGKGKSLLSELKEQRTSHLSEVLEQLSKENLSALAQGLAAVVDILSRKEKN